MLNRLRVASVVWLLSCGFGLVSGGEEIKYPYLGEVTGTSVQLRAGAGINYRSLRATKKGETFLVRGKNAEWLEVKIPDDCPTWMSSKYVHKFSPDNGVVTGDHVNLRSSPSLNSDVLGQVDRNTRVRILEDAEAWYRIVPPEGTSAWISAEFVKYIGSKKEIDERKARRAKVLAALANARQLEAAEMGKDVTQRKFGEIAALYTAVAEKTEDPAEKQQAEARAKYLRDMEKLRAKLVAASGRTDDVKKELEQVEAEYDRQKKELAARKTPPRPEYVAQGWVKHLGLTLRAPGTVKLEKGGKVLFYLKSSTINLKYYVGKMVGVLGKVVETAPKYDIDVIEVTRIDVLCDGG